MTPVQPVLPPMAACVQDMQEQEGTSAAGAALVTYAAPGPTSQETRSSACTTAAGAFGSAAALAALAALDDDRCAQLTACKAFMRDAGVGLAGCIMTVNQTTPPRSVSFGFDLRLH